MTHDPVGMAKRVDVKPHRKAFRELTREHDRLLMLLVDPASTMAEIDQQISHVERAVSTYLEVTCRPPGD